LQYTGIATDDATLEKFIYDDLQKKLGSRTAHVRKSPFEPKSVNTTKKVVRKVVPKKVASKIIRLCSNCRKAGHIKTNCPGVKRTKKVNHVYQDEVEDTEELEVEYVDDDNEEVVLEDDDDEYIEEYVEEYIDNDDENDVESRNCYAVKKKWCKVEYL